jgi:hypothetical protein
MIEVNYIAYGDRRKEDRFEILCEIVAKSEFIAGVLGSKQRNITEIYLLKRETVVIVANS